MIGNRFFAMVLPANRAPPGIPDRSASSPYETVVPVSIDNNYWYTFFSMMVYPLRSRGGAPTGAKGSAKYVEKKFSDSSRGAVMDGIQLERIISTRVVLCPYTTHFKLSSSAARNSSPP